MSLFWTILTVVLALIEAATPQLITIWFAGGSFAALILSVCGFSFPWQLTVFILISILLLIFTKPLVKKIKENPNIKTNTDALIGETAIVTEEIDNVHECGAVKLRGIIWMARSLNGDIIKKDAVVEIKKIEGVKLIVDIKEV